MGGIKQALHDVSGAASRYIPDLHLERQGKELIACCPFHSEQTASFKIYNAGQRWKCFGCGKEGDLIDLVAEAKGISNDDAINFLANDLGLNTPTQKESKKFDWKTGKKIREHFYQDELGNEIIRKEIWKDASNAKIVIPYNIIGVDRHTKTKERKGLKGLKYPVYKLPAIIKAIADSKTIFLTEGCKDSESLQKLGLSATTVGGTTSSWTTQHLSIFPKGHQVVILTDNDVVGKKYGVDTANKFVKHGCIVKLLNLADYDPNMGNKTDVTDWIELSHTMDELLDLVANTAVWQPSNVFYINTKQPKSEHQKLYGDWRDDFAKLDDYLFKKDGLYRYFEKKNSKGEVIPMVVQLSNFAARISKNITRDDGQEKTTAFEIDGFLANGKTLPTIAIETVDFEGMKWIIDKWQGDAIISPVPNVREYLRHSMQQISQYTKTSQTIFNYTGWRKIADKWVYLHAGGAIGADDVTVDLSGEGNLNRYTLPVVNQNMAKESALMALKILNVADLKITIPLLSLVYLTPLCEPLRQADKEPDFVVWVQAKTQSLKSSFAAVLLSHFGKGFNKNTLTASFKGTANSIEKIGNVLKDSLSVIDDFHPSASRLETVKMTQTAQMVLRAWGDRTGRSIMDPKNKTAKFKK